MTDREILRRCDFRGLDAAIKHGGKIDIKTMSGWMLTFSLNGPHNIVVEDESSNTANLSTHDTYQSNDIIEVMDRVLLPKKTKRLFLLQTARTPRGAVERHRQLTSRPRVRHLYLRAVLGAS